MMNKPAPIAIRWALALFFFLSGAVGLCYEVVWARQLSFLLGVSVHAVTAVLVAYMAGLGIGAALAGRLLDRGLAPVRLYAALEGGIGLYLLLFPWLYGLMEPLYVALYPLSGGGGGAALLRFLMAIGLLLIPTTLMGGTLPALVRHFSRSDRRLGITAGRLYAINTFGAMVGALAAGYYFIEAVGLAATSMIGAGVNLLLGVAAWMVAAEPTWRGEKTQPTKRPERKESPVERPDRLIIGLFCVAGFCALALETIWTRLLTLILNNTTYAFTLILSLFLGGIAIGGAVVAWWISRGKVVRVDHWFGVFQILLGVAAGLSVAGFALFPTLMTAPSGGVALFSPAYLFASLLIFPAVFLMGGSFPLAVEGMRARVNDAGGAVGKLYGANTAGCVTGTIVSGFILLPWLGVEKGTLLIGWVAVVSGVTLLLARGGKPLIPVVAVATMGLLTGEAIISDETLALKLTASKLDRGSGIVFFAEGPSATVLVSHTPTDMSVGRKPVERLWINGDPIAGAFREALTLERLLAHIPLLLRPGAQNGLVICFGTGSTAGAALTHGLERLTAVDVSPEVFEAAPHFSEGNQSVMQNRRLRTVVEDGRNFLLTTNENYDFITVEPPPPSNAGVVSLYTVEFYRLAMEKLSKRGIFSQWIPLHHLSPTDFIKLVASFHEVFPRGQLWFTKWDAILVGASADLSIDYSIMSNEMKKPLVASSLAGIGYTDPAQILATYMMGPEELAAYIAESSPFYDDHPTVEFTAPRMLAGGVAIKGENLKRLMTFRSLPPVAVADASEGKPIITMFESQERYLQGHLDESEGAYGQAATQYERALRIDPNNADARYAYLQLNLSTLHKAIGTGKLDVRKSLLMKTNQLDRENLFSTQRLLLEGVQLAEEERFQEAEMVLFQAIEQDDTYLLALLNLAGLYATELHDPVKAKSLYEKALLLDLTEEEKLGTNAALVSLRRGNS